MNNRFSRLVNSLPSARTALYAALLAQPMMALTTACTADEQARTAGGGEGRAVTLSVAAAPMTGATAGGSTRAAEAGVLHRERTFAAGEQIYAYFPEGVNVGSAVYTTVDAAAGSTNATSTDNKPLPTLTQAGGSLAMYAYWPASVTERTATWTVAQNQSAAAAYNASDLMTATGTIQADGQCTNASIGGSQATALTLQHQMARIVVSLTSNSSARMTRLELISGYRTTGLTMPAGTPGGSLTDAVTPAEPLTISSTSATLSATATKFCCLVPPQGFAANEPLLRITTDRGTVTCHTLRAQPLQAGHEYTLTADVTDVTATAAIAEWGQEDVAPGESDEDLYVVNGVKFRMIPVEGGTMTDMYSDQINKSYTSGVHVTLSDYKIAKTETTQQLWQAVTGSLPTIDAAFAGDQKPVCQISWLQIHGGRYISVGTTYSEVAWTESFLYKLNKATATQRPDGWVFALPTHAQWEYAARGGKYEHGFKYSGSDNLDDVAWNSGNASSSTHDVATTATPNELGIYDMHGNLFEFCADWRYESGVTGTLAGGTYSDPAGPVTPASGVPHPVGIGGDWQYGTAHPQYFGYFGNKTNGETGSAQRTVAQADKELGFRVALMPLRQAIMPCHIGWVLTSEGNLYQTAAQATADGETPVAMIAYVATGTEGNGPTKTDASEQYTAPYTHGLAIALTNCDTNGNAVDNAAANLITTPGTNAANLHTYVSKYKPTAPKGTSGWIVPTVYQWMRMLNGCGSTTAYTVSTDVTTFQLGNINTLLGQHTGAVQLSTVTSGTNDGRYYSSTCDGTCGSTSDSPAEYRAGQPAFGTNNNCYLRPILAF